MKTIKKENITIPSECRKADLSLLFESSWEVCNKIGGIYTVLSTKARVLTERYGDKTIFIGPDVWSDGNESPYFLEKKSLLKNASSKIEFPYGITIRTGRWDIPGSPIVVLVKSDGIAETLDEIYGLMWEKYGVDSLHSYGDYSEGCRFGIASAIVMKKLTEFLKAPADKVVAHFDEWTTAMGLLYLQQIMPESATVFTTHATSIGRSICGNGKPLYDYFTAYNGDQMARELNMESKHSLEKAAAHNADCFTTVSEVTAKECEQLLDIRPQVVTPNGFEPDFVPATVKYNRLRKAGREKILNIARRMTGVDYNDDTFIIATSGRNEYRNKGLDLYLDTMSDLGDKLSSTASALALVLVPAWVKEPSGSLLVDMNFNGSEKVEPDFLTHRLNNEDSDSVCLRIRTLESEHRLDNVRVIFVPCYLDGHDGIVDISYYDLLPALDMTVFASYYEPWGYTPLESVAFGVPTVTTDKAGFGEWVKENFTVGIDSCGVDVVDRTDSNYPEACSAISHSLLNYMQEGAAKRKKARKLSAQTAEKADWKYFICKYDDAYELALSNAAKRNK